MPSLISLSRCWFDFMLVGLVFASFEAIHCRRSKCSTLLDSVSHTAHVEIGHRHRSMSVQYANKIHG
jgi:hypothetical protein